MQQTHPTPPRARAYRAPGRSVLLWTLGGILALALIVGLAVLATRPHPLPPVAQSYSLTRGSTGMLTQAGIDYGLSEPGVEPTLDRVEARIDTYLKRLDQPTLQLSRLREFPLAYRADIQDSSTGTIAFTLMIGKASLDISPQAGPNLLWNTRHAATLADLGGGYGMTGRMLPGAPPTAMTLDATQARTRAQQALATTSPAPTIEPRATVHDGYYEFTLSEAGQPTGTIDINGYTGQAWRETWPQPLRQDVRLPSPNQPARQPNPAPSTTPTSPPPTAP